MNKNHLKLLRDPFTGEDLDILIEKSKGDEIIEGILKSSSNTYKITNGIPRFVNETNYSDNFGWQWNKWARVQFEDENINKSMEGHTKNMFKTISELDENKIRNKTVLDIGCGPGRFSDIVLDLGGLPVMIDHSNAIDASKENFKNNSDILFVQGDALNLPFKDEVFDFAFSIGVLHHTPDPQRGVLEANRVLKQGGEFSISVYSENSYYTFPTVHLWRKFFKFLWPLFKHYPPLVYSNIFGRFNHYLGKINKYITYPFRIIFPTTVLPDVRWSVLDTFDSITTSYQSGHTIYEVYYWFKESGFNKIRPGNWRVNLIGTK
jgi:ubiquinone/menaquinone biosynthesis C-methylase UbiE